MPSRRWKATTERLILAAIAVWAFFVSSPALANPWNEHVTRLNSLSRQIENGENEIIEMVKQKRYASDQRVVQGLIKSIAAKHKEIEKASKDYAEERAHVRFHHPDKADKLEREYVRHEMKSIDDLENEMGIDGKLDRVKARALATFPIPEPEKKARPETVFRKPASKVEDDEFAPEKIHLKK